MEDKDPSNDSQDGNELEEQEMCSRGKFFSCVDALNLNLEFSTSALSQETETPGDMSSSQGHPSPLSSLNAQAVVPSVPSPIYIPLTEFHLFPDLPIELRLIILQLAVPCPVGPICLLPAWSPDTSSFVTLPQHARLTPVDSTSQLGRDRSMFWRTLCTDTLAVYDRAFPLRIPIYAPIVLPEGSTEAGYLHFAPGEMVDLGSMLFNWRGAKSFDILKVQHWTKSVTRVTIGIHSFMQRRAPLRVKRVLELVSGSGMVTGRLGRGTSSGSGQADQYGWPDILRLFPALKEITIKDHPTPVTNPGQSNGTPGAPQTIPNPAWWPVNAEAQFMAWIERQESVRAEGLNIPRVIFP